jgi:hypothetical protein
LTTSDSAGGSNTYSQTVNVHGNPLQPGTQCVWCAFIPSMNNLIPFFSILSLGILTGMGLVYIRSLAKNRNREFVPKLASPVGVSNIVNPVKPKTHSSSHRTRAHNASRR